MRGLPLILDRASGRRGAGFAGDAHFAGWRGGARTGCGGVGRMGAWQGATDGRGLGSAAGGGASQKGGGSGSG